jgi:hypothetical protein
VSPSRVQRPDVRPGGALRSREFKFKSSIDRVLPTGYPHLFRFELELASASGWRGNCNLFSINCSLVPSSQESKTKRFRDMQPFPDGSS